MTKGALALLFLFLIAGVVGAQPIVTYTVVTPAGKRLPLEAYRLNGRDYAPLAELVRSVFRGGSLGADGTSIVWKSGVVRSAPASFYILRSDTDGDRMAQMPYPALHIGRELCLPVVPLCDAVETLGLFQADITGRVITLRRPAHLAPTALLLPPVAGETSDDVAATDHVHDDAGESGDMVPTTIITGLELDTAPPHVRAVEDMGRLIQSAPSSRVGAASPAQPSVPPAVIPPPVMPEPPATDTASVQPGRYMLPPGLYRRELLDEDSARSLLEIPTLVPGPPVASLVWPEPAGVEIIAMEVTVESGAVSLSLTGSGPVESFQRPECSGRQLVLRFPGARNGVPAITLRRLGATAPLTSVRAEQVGAILVYRLTFAHEVTRCTYARKSRSRIVFTAQTATGDAVPDRASAEAKKWMLDVIVLDAGHGGRDVGAIGVSGCYEKDITLAIVKKLGALIEKNLPQTRVVYTRKDDRFVELYRRGQIANEAGGKLFISVHCNSMPTKPHSANGFETYILRPGRNEDAVRVAERENSAIRFESNQKRYKALTDEQFIVVNMAQSAFVKLSELFAATVQDEIARATPLESRGVNQAGFYVLVGASMPNILFESAFLSNTEDEKYINSDKGQDAVARGLFNAIRVYAEQYRQILEGQR